MPPPFRPRIRLLSAVLCLLGGGIPALHATSIEAIVSIADQRLAVVRDGGVVAKYPVSTSKFGTGDSFGSYQTPLGRMRVCEKVGDGFAPGAVLKGREATGEILPINAPGRDPIVTRILWLEGLEEQNRRARARAIYIHGTPEESRIGDAASWGCIRMRSRDVISLYDELPVGAEVTVIAGRLPKLPKFDSRRETLLVSQPPLTRPPEPSAMPMTPPILSASRGKNSAALALSGSILLSGLDAVAEAPAP